MTSAGNGNGSAPGYNIVTLMKRLEAATSRLEDLTVVHAETLKRVSERATGTSVLEGGQSTQAGGDEAGVAGGSAGAGSSTTVVPAILHSKGSTIGSGVGTGVSLSDGASADGAKSAEQDSIGDASVPSVVANSTAGGVVPSDSNEEGHVQISDYKELMKGPLTHLLLLSAQFNDPVVEEAVTHLIKVFEAQLKLLKYSFMAQKPDYQSEAFTELHKDISSHAQSIIDLRETNRGSKFFNHLSSLAEGIPGMGWTTGEDAAGIVEDFRDSAQFYANRILKEYKGVDDKQFEWSKTFILVLNELLSYVRKHYPKGLTWNPNGEPLDEVMKKKDAKLSKEVAKTSAEAASSQSTPTPSVTGGSAGGPPPPPPPPPPMPAASVFQAGGEEKSGGMGMNAVFSELNRGEDITKSLKKVDKAEVAKKRNTPPPPKKPASLSHKKSSVNVPRQPSASAASKKPARTELEDTKWIVENHEDNHEIIIQGEMNQGVFVDRCSNCTIQVKGKVSAITLNECKKVGIVVETLVSGLEVIKCTGFGVQVTGTMPTLTVDQSHEGQVYLSKDSLDVDIYTSQTSAINIDVPKNEAEGDYSEMPLPEQLRHRIDPSGKIVSEVVEHM